MRLEQRARPNDIGIVPSFDFASGDVALFT
jgi:hypothetical protein